jgi:hypothetical protein
MKARLIIKRSSKVYARDLQPKTLYKIINVKDGGNKNFIGGFAWLQDKEERIGRSNYLEIGKTWATDRNGLLYIGIWFDIGDGKYFQFAPMPSGTTVSSKLSDWSGGGGYTFNKTF